MGAEEVHELASAPVEAQPNQRTGSLASDILSLFLRPARLFRELPRTNRVSGALLLLMALRSLYGLGLISTGVPDYEIDCDAQKEISGIRQHPPPKDDAEKFTTAMEFVEKQAIFKRKLARVMEVAGEPIQLCLKLCVLSGILYLVVALRGGKANYQVLLGVATFAAYVEVPRLLLRLFLIAQHHVSRVETSAAAVCSNPDLGLWPYLLLRRLDPFEVWYYVLIGLGAYTSGQLKPRAAIITACVLGLLAALLNMGSDLPQLADITGVKFGNS
jgi:hypothetical protein